MTKKKLRRLDTCIIAVNKRAHYEFFIEKELEAGIVLYGWEVKALRSYKANISNSYILLQNNEAYLFGSTFEPLSVASSHITCDSIRNRKLLLNRRELDFLYGSIHYKGYTIIALSLYWKNAWAKLKLAIARGKKDYDKRNDIKYREWNIQKERILKKFPY
ncbi:SsrA-binding protein SmpB [Candidatus Pantoea carbekii]|uniref:SsrA-binding protein n=1 Tax=Candidatus Pantoea carbekii TaxID=1235990 RepID=U3U2N5_9GAMM|nr:SsrA-binding protein SmpB [Candidatus Pantoea carbekii]AKC31882.1 SsrA-binding protein SmpB [Candidatus Pantoea carbekii]BAO00396.1 SmpB protein [Candidatus Pantoea carbekii]